MIRQFALLATTALMIGLAGCTTVAPVTENADTPATTEAPAESTVEESAERDSPETVTLPEAPPAGTDAAIAWEALMGPDDEYHASASYLAVIEKFGEVEPYVSIRAAEDRHSSALVRQLERLGIEVPENPYLGKLQAPSDLTTAARAWADGEVANIAMYDTLLAQTDDAALFRVLTNLRRASADVHLPAFQAAAEQGGTLTPEQMAEFQTGRP